MIRRRIPWRIQLETMDAADKVGLGFMASVVLSIILVVAVSYFPRLQEVYRVLGGVVLAGWSIWFAIGLRRKARGKR